MAKPKADFRVAQSLFTYMITSLAKNCEYRSVRKQLNRREVVFSIQELRRSHRDWILPLKKDKKDYGIPQGFPISGVFANVYLIEFDQMLQQICRRVGGFYRGYSDDFITKYSFKSCR